MTLKQSEKVTNELQTAVAKVVVQLNQALTDKLFEATPVDTGFARTNWIPSIGAPFSGTAGIRAIGSINDALQQSGKQSLSAYNELQGSVFITNNVHYVGQLNAGSSSQAPSGFVDTTIERTVNEFGGRRIQ